MKKSPIERQYLPSLYHGSRLIFSFRKTVKSQILLKKFRKRKLMTCHHHVWSSPAGVRFVSYRDPTQVFQITDVCVVPCRSELKIGGSILEHSN